MKAIIPAAGYATRMYPLTKDRPKALLLVDGKPVIDYTVERLNKLSGIDEIIVVANSRFFHLFAAWAHMHKSLIPITVLDDGTNSEEERLGSVGDIVFALKRSRIKDDVLIVNGDNIFSFDLGIFSESFKNKQVVIGLFDVGSLEIARRMGTPSLDENNKVISFIEKDKDAMTSLCSVGVYFFSKESIETFYKYTGEGNNPDRFGDFISWLCKRKEIYGHIFSREKDYWFDVGSLDTYQAANEFFASQ
jgi:glucose-1-phosphate thymidylyltransferase